MELLRKAVGDKWQMDSTASMKNMTRQVDTAEWNKFDEDFCNNMDGFVLVETPQEDLDKIEQLLGAKGVFKSPPMIKTSQQHCEKCGRENNFLDVVATGLKVHTAQFLVDVFTGKYGHILNTQQSQRCLCYNCGHLLPKTAAKYSKPKTDDGHFYKWSWPF
ncbi:uncharacterized protein LOC129596630 [Paramacrobiotus metropolitanus]|uniref:uncharacterized protein LOC129596630 n=1 Tax=Paramacrobiotus metropolitanus TaxID=2943436 RepID=UPI002445BC6C|nr:uncharacterized protein LOC129596630 [Paramacrobiotus metropolitanus]